jgi:hypothetical protein
MTARRTSPGPQPVTWRRLGRSVDRALDVPGRMEASPYTTLAVALGVGFVVGGGLFTSTTRRLLWAGLALGLRVASLPLVQDQLAALVTGLEGPGRRARRRS